MTTRRIRIFGDPILRVAARPVTRFDGSLRRLVDDLLETVDAPGRAGLAAPQIGVGVRVFSYDVEEHFGYVVNPELVTLEGEQEGEEGCLSLPGLGFPTRRADTATVRGVDVGGNPVEVTGTGLLARCLQHEMDHLDGVLYIDRLDRRQRRRAMRAIREVMLSGDPAWA